MQRIGWQRLEDADTVPGNEHRPGLAGGTRPGGDEQPERLRADEHWISRDQAAITGDPGRGMDLVRPVVDIEDQLADVGGIEIEVWRDGLSGTGSKLNVLRPF
jgi:hypothetical protein